MKVSNMRSIGLLMVCISVLWASACSSNRPQAAPASPSPSPFLGIDSMYKAYMPHQNLKVLVVHLTANTNSQDPESRALSVFHGIESMLAQSDLDIAVIKVPIRQGVIYSYQAFVFSKGRTGEWGPLQDEALMAHVINAHFQ